MYAYEHFLFNELIQVCVQEKPLLPSYFNIKNQYPPLTFISFSLLLLHNKIELRVNKHNYHGQTKMT